MKTRLLPSLMLVTVFLSACAPAAATASPTPDVAQPTATLPALEPTLEPVQTQPVITESTRVPAPTALPVATSRGPELHATDPTTVSLASGQIQFVEFFRFT